MSKRARGDELLLLGSSAASVLDAVLRIVKYLSRRRRLEGCPGKPGEGFVLPEFFISAGIAGGQSYTSLVITRDGDLSGDLVNTAARLQARANAIAPDRNKILLTSHVYQRLKGAGVSIQRVDGINKVDFFNTGAIEFKGVSLTVYDTVFLDTEGYRLGYREAMENLYVAIDKGMWKSRIFEAAAAVAEAIIDNLPGEDKGGRITSYNVCYTKLLRPRSCRAPPAGTRAPVRPRPGPPPACAPARRTRRPPSRSARRRSYRRRP